MAKKKANGKRRGPYVVVRTYSAGVHVGYLTHREGREVVLTETSRVWRWRGANTLHEMALHGVSTTEYTRISEQVAVNTLTEATEVIPCTPEATDNLSKPRWF